MSFIRLVSDFPFQQPISVTVHYTDADVTGLDETTLTLDYWDGGQWVDAATTCDPPSSYDRHPDENWLAVGVCHPTEFGLSGEMGQSQPQKIYLPLILK